MNWLDQPIPRRRALSAVLISNIGIALALLDRHVALKHAAKVYADQEQRLVIFKEATDFLLDRADDRTAVELNDKLDYWRVIRGVD